MKKSIIVVAVLLAILTSAPTAQALVGPRFLFSYPISGFSPGDYIDFIVTGELGLFSATGEMVLENIGYPFSGAGSIYGNDLILFLFAGDYFLDLRVDLVSGAAQLNVVTTATSAVAYLINLINLQFQYLGG